MNRADTLSAIRALGLAVTYSIEWGEYRVTFRSDCGLTRAKLEAHAAYEADPQEALAAAACLIAWVWSCAMKELTRGTRW